MNAVLFGGATLLGTVLLAVGQPAVLLLALGVETGYLYLLSRNVRFQKLVDALALERGARAAEVKESELIAQLREDQRRRLRGFQERIAKLLECYRTGAVDEYALTNSRDALKKVEWMYLKLLVAQRNLRLVEDSTSAEDLKRRIEGIERELQAANLTAATRESKQATVVILKQRADNIARGNQSLEEVESNLVRLDEQLDLAAEKATVQGQSQIPSMSIGLAGALLDSDVYGSAGATVADIDQALGVAVVVPPSREPA